MLTKCEKCGNEYQLEPNEEPSNFQCECGGELKYKDSEEVSINGNNLSESASKDTTRNRIPKHYKKKLLYIGYLAAAFLLINGFSKIYEHFTHITLNGTWEGSIILIIQIIGIVISVYFFIQVFKIKDEIMNDTSEYYNRMLTYLSLAMIFIIFSPTFWV